jgi:hypothetical protein
MSRYILRPPLVLERPSLTADGRVAYERKYQSRGTSHIVMTPVEFLIRLSALVERFWKRSRRSRRIGMAK